MRFGRIAVFAFSLLVLAGVVAVAATQGLDQPMLVGLGSGLALGFGLTLLGGLSVARAMQRESKFAVLTHIYTGIAIRVGVLFGGAFLLMATGWASPVGFALAFLAGVMLALSRQVMAYAGAPARAAG